MVEGLDGAGGVVYGDLAADGDGHFLQAVEDVGEEVSQGSSAPDEGI